MATVIGHYAGEGCNTRDMADNKELVVYNEMDEFRAPAVLREELAQRFVQQKFNDPKPEWEDYVADMVIIAVVSAEGDVQTGEAYEAAYDN